MNLEAPTAEPNRVQPIRPGDTVDGASITAETLSGAFAVSLDCAGVRNAQASDCDGLQSPAASSTSATFHNRVADQGRLAPKGVAILIDQSGSTTGLADGMISPDTGEPVCLEGAPGEFEVPFSLSVCASDAQGNRLLAARRLLEQLDTNDRAVVYTFNEYGVGVVCSGEAVDSARGNPTAQACYSTDRSLALGGGGGASALDVQQGLGQGRSNLWSAVTETAQFLASQTEATRHIVVIADGPDTCGADSAHFRDCLDNPSVGLGPQPQSHCAGTASFSDSLKTIRGSGVSVSFIHFLGPGYPNADPLMQRVACETGGHYRLVEQPGADGTQLRTAMEQTADELRTAFAGHWGVVAHIPELALGNPPAGQILTLAGTLSLKLAGTANDAPNASVNFGASGQARTQHLLKPCSSGDCSAVGADWSCHPDRRVCDPPPAPATCPAE